MKIFFLFIWILLLDSIITSDAIAQCSICTKTAQQLGDGAAEGFNTGILYLAFLPLLIICYVAYRWWKNEKKMNNE